MLFENVEILDFYRLICKCYFWCWRRFWMLWNV